jgi:transmembrane protein 17
MREARPSSKQFLHAAAENIFPSYRKLSNVQMFSLDGKKQKHYDNIPVEVSSHLPLQILMTSSSWLYPIWVISTLNTLILKVPAKFSLQINYGVIDFHRFMIIALLPVFLVCEPLRLRFGYLGNLQESIPDLAGFLLLSAFPQLPITIYYIVFQPISILGFSLPMDIALNVVYAVLILFQIVFACFGARQIVASHAAQFMLRDFHTKNQ